jgi:hypothetical protein
MEPRLTLEFACCCCDGLVSVTVTCRDQGSSVPSERLAAVNVPCPNCGEVNQLFFEPDGSMQSVRPLPVRRLLPVPSVN